MARSINQLTERKVSDLARHAEAGRHHDGAGLYLQIKEHESQSTKKPKSGKKPKPPLTCSWVLRYSRDGRERFYGIGPLHTVNLGEARERARKARLLLLDGIDPIEARRSQQEALRSEEQANITFKEAAEAFLDLHEEGWRNDKHRQQWRNTLAEYAFPKLGSRPVKVIDAALVNATLAPIWQTVPETARRVRQRIERVVQWVKAGRPQPNNGAARRVKHHNAPAIDDVPAFMSELRSRNSVSAHALEFLILTAARTGDVIGATWNEIDFGAKTWTIPAERMKAGREHTVPLSARAIEILRSLLTEKGNRFVFIGANKGSGLSNMAMLQLLRGMREGLTVHGFRSTFKDWASERTNHPNIVSEMALAHTIKDKVERAYRRGDLLVKRTKLMNEWAKFCAAVPAEVVSMKKVARS